MKKIVNPWDNIAGFDCFGCSKSNPFGLKLSFFEDGDFIVAEYLPDIRFQGYHNVLHGGIQATLLDEIASWVVYVKLQTAGVTSALNIKYRNPVIIGDGAISLRASVKEHSGRIANIRAELYNSKNKLCSEADIQYFIFPPEIAKEKYHYPGIEKFYSTNGF